MEYRFISISEREVNLYPLVCWHLGARQSDMGFIQRVLKQIKEDPLARWIYMGDAGECNIKESKGDLYSQTMPPGEQMDRAVELLEPIREKGLFGVNGNHGARIYKATGVGWDKTLCEKVGVPYCGNSALVDLAFDCSGKARTVSVYVHHGAASAITPGGKTAAGKKPEAFVLADIILTAHSHACGELICPRHYVYSVPRSKVLKWGVTRSFLCGSAYDSRTGYAEMKLYPPILPEHLVLKIGIKSVEPSRTLEPKIESRKITAF